MAMPSVSEGLEVEIGSRHLCGNLGIPAGACGLVVIADGSEIGGLSPRNQYVARRLREFDLATLLFDLGDSEPGNAAGSEDQESVADRLTQAVAWARQAPEVSTLPLGILGSRAGANAALILAATRQSSVQAVVSCDAYLNLNESTFERVKAATLLIVSGQEDPASQSNRQALKSLSGDKRLDYVPGASHLFSEPGAFDEIARRAGCWFRRHLLAAKPFGGAPQSTATI